MQDRTPALFALKKTVDDKMPFSLALAKTIGTYNLNAADKNYLVQSLNGVLRHFLLLRAEVLDVFPQFVGDADEVYLLILGLFELRLNKTSAPEIIGELLTTAKLHDLHLTADDIEKKLVALADNPDGTLEKYKEDSLVYNSLLFNTPEWVLAAYLNEYGTELTTKTLLSLREKPNLFLTVNTLKKKAADYTSDQRFMVLPSHSPTYSTGASLLARTQERASQYKEVINGLLFPQDYAFFCFLDALPYLQYGQALHVNGKSGLMAAALALRLAPLQGKVTVAYTDEKHFARGKALHRRLSIQNSQALLAPTRMVKTLVTFAGHDLVVVTPSSSRLGQVRRKPDASLAFAPDTFKVTLQAQEEDLLEASFFVAVNGHLAYTVPSILKEEGEDRVNAFLEQRKNFVLVSQKLIFPFAEDDKPQSDGLYYAVLERKS